jgi:hypothetical protein
MLLLLLQNRSMFPISLCATHISGTGNDCMFFGVVRPSPPPVAEGKPVVRFWTNPAGTVLCVDRNVADNFGHEAPELVGVPFSSLCTDDEGVERCECLQQYRAVLLCLVAGLNVS